ncbi:hypothetical protein AHAS_Ahas09G0108300 [Arachis hypogaea]
MKVITRHDAGGHSTLAHRVGATVEQVVRQKSDEPVKGQSSNGWTKKIEVPVASENVVWLQRSIVGGTKTAIDFNSLQQKIHRDWPGVTQVRELGAYKAIITFDSVLSAEEAYTFRMNELLKLFYMVWKWDETEKNESRRVWLEYYGVPIHAWSRNTFHRIGEQWGKVVECDKLTESGNSFSVVGGEMYREECFRKTKEDAKVRQTINEEEVQHEPIAVGWDPAVVQTKVDHRIDEQGRDRDCMKPMTRKKWFPIIMKDMSAMYMKKNGLEVNRPNIIKKRQDDGLIVKGRRAAPAGGCSKRAGSDPDARITRTEEIFTNISRVSMAPQALGKDADSTPNRDDAGQQNASEEMETGVRTTGHGGKQAASRMVPGHKGGVAGESRIDDEAG